jgi:hypothetical protein
MALAILTVCWQAKSRSLNPLRTDLRAIYK